MDQVRREHFFDNHLAGIILLVTYLTLFGLDCLLGGR